VIGVGYCVTGNSSKTGTAGLDTLTTTNINNYGSTGLAPLHVALRSGKVDEFERIIALGGNPFLHSRADVIKLRSGDHVSPAHPPEYFIDVFAKSEHQDKAERSERLRELLAQARQEWTQRQQQPAAEGALMAIVQVRDPAVLAI
jgi:hypothetical protein